MAFSVPKQLYFLPPLLLPLVAYIASTAFYWGVKTGSILALYGIYALYISALFIALGYKKLNPYLLIIVISAVSLGFVRNYQTISYYRSFPFNITEKTATIRGILTNYSHNPVSRFSHCHTIAVHMIQNSKQQTKSSYSIQLYTQKKLTAEVGDTIELKDMCLKHPKDDEFYRYLMKEGIAATGFKQEQHVTLLSRNSISPTRWIFNAKQTLFRTFKAAVNKQTFAFFSAIFLGEKTALKQDKSLESPFKQWGIVHYLARSGLHLVIIISLCSFLMQWIPVGFVYKQFLLASLVTLYALLSWTSISFMRALLIFFMYTLCLLSRRPHHLMQLLLLCCFVFLLINPLYVLFLDFQLSFGLTFALAWLNLYRTVLPTKQ